MLVPLLLSSVAAGLVANVAMLIVLYMPLLWGGIYYDVLGSIGTALTRKNDARAHFIGALMLTLGGIVFALAYGFIVLMFEYGPFLVPNYRILPDFPLEINLIYPLLGLAGGLGHGMFMVLITSFIITDHHPLKQFREPGPLIGSYIIGHTVYGVVVMFFQSQFLQALL